MPDWSFISQIWCRISVMFSQDMSKNNCPYCNEKVSYWEKLKPAFGSNQQFVLCPCCHKKISNYWLKHGRGTSLSLLGVSSGSFLAHSKNPATYFFALIAFILILYMYAATRVELKQFDEVAFEKEQAEYRTKETTVNFTRVALIVVASVAGFALFIWFIGHG